MGYITTASGTTNNVNEAGKSGINSDNYDRIVFSRGRYAAVNIAGNYNDIIINGGCRFDGRFMITGDYNRITVHNDVIFNNGLSMGDDLDATVGVGNHVKCLGNTVIRLFGGNQTVGTGNTIDCALSLTGHYSHFEGSGMPTKIYTHGAADLDSSTVMIGLKQSGFTVVTDETKWCILENVNAFHLKGNGEMGDEKYMLRVGSNGDMASGHLIMNNWFGTHGDYDTSVSDGQDSTGSGAGILLSNATIRFVENSIQPVYTGAENLRPAPRNIVLNNHSAHGGSVGMRMEGADNAIVAGNHFYWNDAKSASTEAMNVDSDTDRCVIVANRAGAKTSMTDNSTNSAVANNEFGAL